MAVGLESAVESHTGGTGSASEAFFDIAVTFSANSKGLLVFSFVNLNADDALSVKINPAGANIDVPAVAGGRAVDTAAEPGDCKAWFLGSGLPTSAGTVRINRTNNANVMYAVAMAVTALGNTEVTGVVLEQEDQALTEENVNDGSPGTNSMRFAGVNSGKPNLADLAIGANSTALADIDFTPRIAKTVRETTAGQGARPIGWDATLDDVAAVYLAVREVAAAANVPPRPTVVNFAATRASNY